jgi:hypothetical protein
MTIRLRCDARPLGRLLMVWAVLAGWCAAIATAQEQPAAKAESLPTQQEAL